MAASASLALLLWESARNRPDHPAVLERDTGTSFAALRDRAAAVGDALLAAGLASGDRVGVLIEHSVTAIASVFGIQAAGMVAVVINDRLRPRQIEHHLAHCGARVLLASPAMLERLPRALTTATAIVDVTAVGASGGLEPVLRQPRDLAQIIYTSGSTGLSKGVVFSHGALQSGVAIVNRYLGQRREDRIASLLGPSTVYGLNQVLTAIACGASLVIEKSPLPAEMITTLKSRAATVLAAVPPLWLQLLGIPHFNAAGLPHLRLLQNAGGHLPVETVGRVRTAFPGAQLFLQYGQTETFRGTFLPPNHVDGRPGSMGRAVPEADIRVLSREGVAVNAGEIGELVHAGPTIANGYWNDPEATQRVFRPHPDPGRAARGEKAVFSGDLVRRDADGFFTFVARRDHLIKTMGFRVGPDEVTDVLHASGEIQEAVVTSEPDPDRGERIVAFVILREGGDLKRVIRFARAELPPYMVPARYESVTRLPRLASGKYDVTAIAKPSQGEPA